VKILLTLPLAGLLLAQQPTALHNLLTKTASDFPGKAGIWAGTFDEPHDWRETHHDGPVERKHGTLASIGDALREIFRFW